MNINNQFLPKAVRYPGIILVFIFVGISCSQQTPSIYEPTVVGTPPRNAYIGLMRLDNGEIRHYTYSDINKENRPFYIRSRDNGLTWDTVFVDNEWTGADVKSPVSGEYIRLLSTDSGVVCTRSSGGIDGTWEPHLVYEPGPDEGRYIMLKPPKFANNGERILVGAHSTKRIGCGVFYSDDDGLTWKRSAFVNAPPHQPGGKHKGTRWNHGAVEPTVVELNDGRIWMLARTARDKHYESFSADGGETWSEMQPSRFYGTITMPTIGRLDDGRLLLIWNNTTPRPEKARADGHWEDVFTNRDVIHAAISDDDGKTWKGFRELYLNPNRNDPDYAESDQSLSLDMSVQQNQFIELSDGKVLISLGQHALHRKLVKFDPAWLYETSREDDFSDGLENWSTFLYKKGIVGHCAHNRAGGARLVPDPAGSGSQVMKIARPRTDELETPNQGAVWNFPALQKGVFETRVYIPEGSTGGKLSLLDRWFNPGDTTAFKYAMFHFDLKTLAPDQWHDLRFEWDLSGRSDYCSVVNAGGETIARLPLNRASLNGISYVHFISDSQKTDDKGFYIEEIAARAD